MQQTKIPKNHEHIEAAQADVDKRRADIKAKMPDKERSNLELIERVSAELKQANIAYVLFARPYETKNGFFQFNWLYTEGAEDFYSEKALKSCNSNINGFLYSIGHFLGHLGYFVGILPPKD
jgi:hypothetical protein